MGRILIIEFNDQDTHIFEKIVKELERYTDFEKLQLSDASILSIPMLDIHLKQRKVYSSNIEIKVTTKEFELLCLLLINKGIVLTYKQIYEKIWTEDALCNVNNTVGCHIRSLRRKLNKSIPNAPFNIRCTRAVGYCFEVYEST